MKSIEKESVMATYNLHDTKHTSKPALVGVFLECHNDLLISFISLSLTQSIDSFNIVKLREFGEASQYLVEKKGKLLITDSETYLDLASKYDPKLFKIKIENEFSYSYDKSDLESKPFIYESENNLLRLRKKSFENTRFLYEIFSIALNPPLVDLTFSCLDTNDSVMYDITKKLKKKVPFAKLKTKKSDVDPVDILDIDIRVHNKKIRKKVIQMNNSKKEIKKSRRFEYKEDAKGYLDCRTDTLIVFLGTLLKNSGYINFYPDLERTEECITTHHRIRVR